MECKWGQIGHTQVIVKVGGCNMRAHYTAPSNFYGFQIYQNEKFLKC